MTFFIACLCIHGFNMSWAWYPIAFIGWVIHDALAASRRK